MILLKDHDYNYDNDDDDDSDDDYLGREKVTIYLCTKFFYNGKSGLDVLWLTQLTLDQRFTQTKFDYIQYIAVGTL